MENLNTEQTVSKKELLRLANEKIVRIEKDLVDAKSSKEVWYKKANEYENEINALHDVLDSLPNSPSKRKDGAWSDTTVLIRLCVWLASK